MQALLIAACKDIDFIEAYHYYVRSSTARFKLYGVKGVPSEMLNRILVVDDSAALHQIYKITLSRYKCDIIPALSGQEGLNKLADNPDFSLIIVDANMPHMSGLEFIKRVMEQETYNGIPIIVVTSIDNNEYPEEAFTSAQGILRKPFTSTELHALIEKLFFQPV